MRSLGSYFGTNNQNQAVTNSGEGAENVSIAVQLSILLLFRAVTKKAARHSDDDLRRNIAFAVNFKVNASKIHKQVQMSQMQLD
jgi:hypothetical protein